jgi:hypothetical protein
LNAVFQSEPPEPSDTGMARSANVLPVAGQDPSACPHSEPPEPSDIGLDRTANVLQAAGQEPSVWPRFSLWV